MRCADGRVFTDYIQIVEGALGGIIAGCILQVHYFGFLGNSLVGIIGGGMTNRIGLEFNVTLNGGGLDHGSIVSDLISGLLGGCLLMLLIALLVINWRIARQLTLRIYTFLLNTQLFVNITIFPKTFIYGY